MRKRLNEIAKEKAEAHEPLLSNYNGEFWDEYLSNYEIYDTYFTRKFEKFYYCRDSETATSDFVMDCKTWLTLHAKDLSELYRIHSIDDDDYSLTNNYDMTEELNRETNEGTRQDTTTKNYGSKSSTTTDNIGARNTENVEQVSPFDSATWNNNTKNNTNTQGTQDTSTTTNNGYMDTDNYNKGLQHDTEEYTLTRKGNIGTMTATDMLEKHENFWDKYNFYSAIFDNLAKEFLMAQDPDRWEDYLCW